MNQPTHHHQGRRPHRGSFFGLAWWIGATTLVGFGLYIGAFGVIGIVVGIAAAYENQRREKSDGGWW